MPGGYREAEGHRTVRGGRLVHVRGPRRNCSPRRGTIEKADGVFREAALHARRDLACDDPRDAGLGVRMRQSSLLYSCRFPAPAFVVLFRIQILMFLSFLMRAFEPVGGRHAECRLQAGEIGSRRAHFDLALY